MLGNKTNKDSGMQLSLFDTAHPLKITKPLRLIELFAGIGAQAKALENLGIEFEHYRICEFDKYAVASYNAIHGTDFTTSDITKIHAEDLGIVDTDKYEYIMTYSFPCFPAKSLVLTDKGYKSIEDIKIGDMVLSHDNSYQKVTKTFNNGTKPLLQIKAMAIDEIKCTPNHLFYVRTMTRSKNKRMFGEPQWKTAQCLTKQDYLGVAINKKSIIHEWSGIDLKWQDGRKTRHKNEISAMLNDYDFWWIIGRYIGDGWLRTQGGIIICCGFNKLDDLVKAIAKYFNYTVIKERTVYKIHIPKKELGLFCAQFGKGALNKHLTQTILDLPKHLLKGFLNGYVRADGYIYSNGVNSVTSISRVLLYGIAQCVAKVYNVPYGIYKIIGKKTATIENRVVNQHDTYTLKWKNDVKKQDEAFVENGHIWFPVREVKTIEAETVYDIQVDKNHSFTVQNTIVHNCTDLSKAGKQQGMNRESKTRSGLLWEVERLLKETKELPQILLMENVPDVLSKKFSKDFFAWCEFLEQLGYTNKYAVLNAKNYGVPQNRERCFMLSWLGDYSYNFPNKKPLTKKLKDVLELNVDKKYYLTKRVSIKFNLPIGGGGKIAKTIRVGGRASYDKKHCWDVIVESRQKD